MDNNRLRLLCVYLCLCVQCLAVLTRVEDTASWRSSLDPQAKTMSQKGQRNGIAVGEEWEERRLKS